MAHLLHSGVAMEARTLHLHPSPATTTANVRVGLRALPREGLVRLDQLFEQLADAVDAGSREAVAGAWPAFDRELRAHFDLEERLIFPRLRRLYPAKVDELLREHAQLRDRLDVISVDLELHQCRLPMIAELIELLAAHARREDVLMYRWAE